MMYKLGVDVALLKLGILRPRSEFEKRINKMMEGPQPPGLEEHTREMNQRMMQAAPPPEKLEKKWQGMVPQQKTEDPLKGLKDKSLTGLKFGGVAIIPDRGENRETYQFRPEVETPATNAPMAPTGPAREQQTDTDTQLNTIWADHDARAQLRPDPSKWDWEYVSPN
jgi:hypothetical protein